MGLLSLTLPTIGQPNSTEDSDVRNCLSQIQNVINGSIDSSNLANSAVSTSKLADGSVTAAKLVVRRAYADTNGGTLITSLSTNVQALAVDYAGTSGRYILLSGYVTVSNENSGVNVLAQAQLSRDGVAQIGRNSYIVAMHTGFLAGSNPHYSIPVAAQFVLPDSSSHNYRIYVQASSANAIAIRDSALSIVEL